ncbi:hypothetical protein A2U01_0066740, partial [Trifolium medium]|nr:hypothetical protein [Trifolium medium]
MPTFHFNRVSESVFESLVRSLHEVREREKENGRAALRTPFSTRVI